MANEWIWNEIKLPEDGKKVLAYCGWNGDMSIAVRRDGKWYSAWDNATKLCCISHWMPLPENKPNSGEYWRMGG